MTPETVMTMCRTAMEVTLMVAAPMLLVALIIGAFVAWQHIASLGWVIGAWGICALISLALVVPMVLHPEATIRRRVLRGMVRQDEIVSNRWMG